METLTVEFRPDSRLSKTGLRRGHWRESQPLIKQLREDAFVLGLVEKEDGWETPKQCRVEGRQYWGGKPFDWDGLAALTAPVIDGLVDAGAMPIDVSPAYVGEYTMTAERGSARSDSKVAVTVVPVSG